MSLRSKYFKVMIRISAIILWIPLLSGCIKLTKKNSNSDDGTSPSPVPVPAPVEAPSVTTPAQSNVGFSIEEGEKPHQYFLKINWKADFKKIVIEDDLNKNQKIFESSNDNLTDKSDGKAVTSVEIKDDTNFKLSVLSEDDQYPQIVGIIEGKTPKDYVIESNQELKQSTQIDVGRFYILNSAKLKTNGFDLVIRAKKIFSENAEVLTFESTSGRNVSNSNNGSSNSNNAGVAANGIDGVNGKSGGMIDISSQAAEGFLTVNLRGQAGGDGMNGVPFIEQAPMGRTGDSGGYSSRTVDSGKVVYVLGETIKISKKQYYCIDNPGDGHRGENGVTGHRGGNAGSGGSSGVLNLNIDEQSSFQVQVNREIGVAGKIGEGGPGQLGGFGGPAGQVIMPPMLQPARPLFDDDVITEYCKATSDGEAGENGPQGANGFPGTAGALEKSCVSIGQGKGYCR